MLLKMESNFGNALAVGDTYQARGSLVIKIIASLALPQSAKSATQNNPLEQGVKRSRIRRTENICAGPAKLTLLKSDCEKNWHHANALKMERGKPAIYLMGQYQGARLLSQQIVPNVARFVKLLHTTPITPSPMKLLGYVMNVIPTIRNFRYEFELVT